MAMWITVKAGRMASRKVKSVRMKNLILYFAYGSNMEPVRMAWRCPGAYPLGRAVLRNYKLTERLYADIDFLKAVQYPDSCT